MNWTNLASVVPVIVVGYALMVTVLFFSQDRLLYQNNFPTR